MGGIGNILLVLGCEFSLFAIIAPVQSTPATNMAAARAVDREFKYNAGFKLGPLGSGSALKRRVMSAEPVPRNLLLEL